jgi:hypothetical protein
VMELKLMRFNPNGTRPLHRNDYYLVSEKVLSRGEFLIYEFLINQMGFDPKYQERFGIVEISNFAELASFFGYSSDNSVRGKVAKLVKLGLLEQVGKSSYRIFAHERSLANTKTWSGKDREYLASEMNQEPRVIFQNLGLKTQINEETSQLNEEKSPILLKSSPPRYLSSSKVSSNPSVSAPITRPLTEYQAMNESGEFPGLTIDDMQWIDGHLYNEQYP